eukprot:1658413-Rhodomonas_salina.1
MAVPPTPRVPGYPGYCFREDCGSGTSRSLQVRPGPGRADTRVAGIPSVTTSLQNEVKGDGFYISVRTDFEMR